MPTLIIKGEVVSSASHRFFFIVKLKKIRKIKMLEELLSVTKKQPEMISPSLEIPHHTLYLTEMDHLGGIYVPCLSVYENNRDNLNPATVIKDALAKVLVFYYPIAGRLMETGEDSRLQVNCNSEGVLFVEAQAKCTLNDVSFLTEPYTPSRDTSLLFNLDLTLPLHQLPFITIQVTTFQCGGFVIGTKSSHRMMDARGFSSTPVWERQRLAAREPPQINVEDFKEVVTDRLDLPNTKSMCCSIFHIPQGAIDGLKSSIVHESKGVLSYCSTFEALLVLIWRIYVQSMDWGEDAMGFHFPVNARRALAKVLPEGYYGNCATFVEVKSQDLTINLDAKIPSNAEVVKAVRVAMEKVDEEYMRSWIDRLCEDRKHKRIPDMMLIDKMVFSDWTKFDWIPDFGVGKGKRVENIFQAICPKHPFVTFLPKERGGNGYQVGISLAEEKMPLFKVCFAKVVAD